MRLEQFQRDMLRPYFDGVTETVIIVPKKNGKSTLLAALSLYHLARVPDAECVVGASSRDQATILYDQAAKMVERSGMDDVFDCKGGYRMIRLQGGDRSGARIRVLASNVDNADGVIPTLALVDELHRHPDAQLYGVFRDGLDARDGQMLTISTAGSAMDSPLGQIRDNMHAAPIFKRDEERKRTYAHLVEGSMVLFEWSLSPGDDIEDMRIVKKANPASWQTPAKLRRRRLSASMTTGRWKRFACGLWTEGEEPWLAPEEWDVCQGELSIEHGEHVVVGIGYGWSGQDSAIVTLAPRGEGFAVEASFVPSESLLRIEQELEYLHDVMEVEWFVYGSPNLQRSAEVLEGKGLPMLEFPLTPARMSPASTNLLRLIQERRLVHSGDGKFRAHVLAGSAKDYERGWRIVQDPRTRKPVAGLIALALAVAVAQGDGSVSPYVEVI